MLSRLLFQPFQSPNNLSDRLAADKDFQEFSFLIYDFTGKVQATKSGRLVLNYFEHKITADESNTLFRKLGFASKEEFTEYWKKIYQLKENFQAKFTELINLSDAKAIVECASQKVAAEKEFFKLVKYPVDYCWYALVALLTGCQQAVCNPAFHTNNPYFSYNNCMDVCIAFAITGSAGCFLFAD